MASKTIQQMIDVLVLGGGISGLVAGYYSQKKNKSTLILEKSGRVGGVIRSEWKDGFLLEFGPNTVTSNENLFKLFKELRIEKDLLKSDSKTPRFIQLQEKLHAVPLSPPQILSSSLLSFSEKLRVFREPFVPKKENHADETIVEFISRRFGAGVAEKLLKPFLAGVWAGDGTKLSAISTFPQLCKFEKEWGSVLKGLISKKKSTNKNITKGLFSFSSGLIELVSALQVKLHKNIRFNQNVVTIRKSEEGRWIVKTDQDEFSAKNLIISIPSYESAAFFTSISPSLTTALQKISYAPLALLHLGIAKNAIGRNLNGFGYLVAPSENKNILGCVWSSSIFPNRAPNDQSLLTVFIGGSLKPDLMDKSDDELVGLASDDLSQALGLREKPRVISIKRLEKAIPQYTIGYTHITETIQKAEKSMKGLKFIGNIKGGISVGDVVKNAEEATSKLI